jgi:hypothetical protein
MDFSMLERRKSQPQCRSPNSKRRRMQFWWDDRSKQTRALAGGKGFSRGSAMMGRVAVGDGLVSLPPSGEEEMDERVEVVVHRQFSSRLP